MQWNTGMFPTQWWKQFYLDTSLDVGGIWILYVERQGKFLIVLGCAEMVKFAQFERIAVRVLKLGQESDSYLSKFFMGPSICL